LQTTLLQPEKSNMTKNKLMLRLLN